MVTFISVIILIVLIVLLFYVYYYDGKKQPQHNISRGINYCRNCGGSINGEHSVCVICGFELLNGHKYCQQCGRETKVGQRLCISCGFELLSLKAINDIDKPSFGFGLLGFFMPIVGLIIYLLWYETQPGKAKSAGSGALASLLIGLIVFVYMLFIMLALRA